MLGQSGMNFRTNRTRHPLMQPRATTVLTSPLSVGPYRVVPQQQLEGGYLSHFASLRLDIAMILQLRINPSSNLLIRLLNCIAAMGFEGAPPRAILSSSYITYL